MGSFAFFAFFAFFLVGVELVHIELMKTIELVLQCFTSDLLMLELFFFHLQGLPLEDQSVAHILQFLLDFLLIFCWKVSLYFFVHEVLFGFASLLVMINKKIPHLLDP